jgi:sugar porter (SP) family MFS transporter
VLPASWQSGFNSISSVGQFFGGFACSWCSDRIGRRYSLLIGLVFVTGGIFGEVFSNTRPAFLIGKLILGIGLGFYLSIGPLYCSEVAPVVLRGIVTGGINFAIVIGQLLSNAVIKGFGDRTDRWAFRGPFAVQWLFVGKSIRINLRWYLTTDRTTAILLAGIPFAPESPWHYVRKGRIEDARRSLERLHGKDTDVGPRLAMIVRTVEEDMELTKSARWAQCFQGTNLIRTTISVGGFACQHLSGIVFVLGFSTYFFELAGIKTSEAFDLGVGVTAVGVVGVIISWMAINTLGRRKLFVGGMVGMTIVLVLMGIMDVVHTSAARWVEASCTVVYALIYQITIGCIAFALLGEVSTPSLRAKTVGLATACQAVFGTVMNIVVPYMVNPDKANLKGKVGFVFGGACLLGTIWSYFYIPELKGRTFQEIDYLFHHRVPPRKMGRYNLDEVDDVI